MIAKLDWYTVEDVNNEKDNRVLVGMAYAMWGNCYIEKPPSDFGDVMVAIGQRLGVAAIEKNLDVLAEKIKNGEQI